LQGFLLQVEVTEIIVHEAGEPNAVVDLPDAEPLTTVCGVYGAGVITQKGLGEFAKARSIRLIAPVEPCACIFDLGQVLGSPGS